MESQERMNNRPKITLTIPQYNQNAFIPNPQTAGMYTGSIPTAGIQGQYVPGGYINPMATMYPQKAGEFMFKQFSGLRNFTMTTAKSGLSWGEKSAFWIYNKFSNWSRKWFTHIFLFLVVLVYSFAGAALFHKIEGGNQSTLIATVRADRQSIAESIAELDKKSFKTYDEYIDKIASIIIPYESTLKTAWKSGLDDVNPMEGKRGIWTFPNAVLYCGTIYTTIGYGHISPSTKTGKILTIVYAVIGIPLFLILLADFGKLFTRGIKFIWAFVRRLYYTGSCRKIRKTAQAKEMMRGINMVYDIATFRRPSMIAREQAAEGSPPGTFMTQLPPPPPHLGQPLQHLGQPVPHLGQPLPHLGQPLPHLGQPIPHLGPLPPQSPHSLGVPSTMDSPVTPAPENFEIDDEFNLPISVAFTILLMYMLCGAALYSLWEEWSFFDSFYFVFISMSTIGFGDFVPKHPIFMMMSIIYLVFGLALTSMCINVIQAKLSDHFKHASAKIGATIGLKLAEEEAARQSTAQTPQIELGVADEIESQAVPNQSNELPPIPPKPGSAQYFDFSRPTVPTRRKSTTTQEK